MTETRKDEYRVFPGAAVAKCRSCHAIIIWTMTATYKPIPLSVATIRVDEQGARWALSHFSDCPNARQHRSTATRAPAPQTDAPRAQDIDLRDLPDYLERNNLAVIGTTVTDDGNGRLFIEIQTRQVNHGL